MDFTKTSIKRPVTVIMAMLVVIILGVVSLTGMDMALIPDIEMPVALIMTQYQGAGPEEVETLVTETIENAVANIEDMDTITSMSSEGISIVVAQFNYGTDMDKAVSNIRDQVGMYEMFLPDDATSPTILKMNMNAMPIAALVVSGENMSEEEIKTFAEDEIKPIIERISGVASVDVTGGAEHEILVEFDLEKMQGLGLSMTTVGGILASENNNMSGGNIDYGDKTLTISSKLKLENIDDVKQTPITLANGSVVQLQDIATVSEKEKEVSSVSRYNGERCIMLSVTAASDGNTVNIVKGINKEITKINAEYPQITAELAYETGSTIENSINAVIKNIFTGAFLAILILFIFLKNVGLTGVIAISMPISIIGTFVLLYFSGTNLNMVSLGGLSIGVGMLVDNSVVVLENIYRYRTTEGYGRIKGTYLGTKEVALSITASTLTTIVVFLPFIFSSGIVTQIFTDLAFSVVFSLVMSLVVALTVVPMLSANYVSNVHRNTAPKPFGFINKMLDAFDRFIKYLDKIYAKVLAVVLNNKKKTLCIVLAAFIFSVCLIPKIGMELMPMTDEGSFTVTVSAPKGSSLETVNNLSLQAESIIEEIPELSSMTVSMSGSSSAMSAMMGGANESSISCELVDKTERSRSTDEVVEDLRNKLSGIAGAEISVSSSSSMMSMTGSGISVEIYGDETDVLQSISDELASQFEQIEGTREITSSLEEQDKQIAVNINKDKIRQYGLTGSSVASQIRNSVTGYTATTLKANGTEMDIRIAYKGNVATTVDSLKDIVITTNSGLYIPLSSIAEITMDEVPTSIYRTNQQRYITLSCGIYGRDTGSVSREIQSLLDNFNFPDGYTASITGTSEMMNEVFTSLVLVILLAVVLVYMVMASQFESLINPFIIMFTIPLAFTGAFILLFVTGEPISMMALIGCLILVGIVVNNGIVLIDYTNILRDRDGMEIKEAVLKACPTRLRPILMTALTTILGQMPMIFSRGANSELLKGMGIVIAGGLTTSTFLTLLVVPTLYMIFDNISTNSKINLK